MSGARFEKDLLYTLTPSDQLLSRYTVEELERMERMEGAKDHPQ